MADLEKTLSHFHIAKRSEKRIQAFCPAHEDKNASLSILVNQDKILIFCHAGCYISDILKAADLTYADLFNDKSTIGVYQYRYENNDFAYEKIKDKTQKGKTFWQRSIQGDDIIPNIEGIKQVPYNYPKVIEAIKSESPILYVEGEKDADTGRLLGYTSTTMGGASSWKDEYSPFFKNAVLILIPDKDNPGLKLGGNVTNSLVKVAKSIKVVILPAGKDLTEWVEAGNSDLESLISKAQELVTFKGISEPQVTKTLSGFDFTWRDLNVLARIERLTDDAEAIIVVKDLNNQRILHTSKINLLATRSLTELSNRLAKSKNIAWETLLSNIANRCFDSLSDAGQTVNIDEEPVNMNIEYLLEPLLPLGEPVTIFSAGGKGKSIIADYIAVLVQYGLCGDNNVSLFSRQANVLYLDWEADAEIHRRYITAIKKGLGIEDKNFIAYRRLEFPLHQINDSIREEIVKKEIEFVIIDSQMAATAGGRPGLTEAQIASEYYNLIRSWGISTLTIDHITKEGMNSNGDSNNVAPYGSVVKYNRSRSQFELRLDDGEDDDHKEYVLLHKKFNLGKKIKPFGFSVDFSNNGHGLEKIVFKSINIVDNPVLNKTLQKHELVKAAILKYKGIATIAQIAEYIGISDKDEIVKIGSYIANDKKRFVSIERGKYGLSSRES
jgi:hypothetical protein